MGHPVYEEVLFFEMSQTRKQKSDETAVTRKTREHSHKKRRPENRGESALRTCTQIVFSMASEPDFAVARMKMSQIHLLKGSLLLA